MAVYGDQLAFFPELFETFENYSMQPGITAGMNPRNLLGTFRGIIQFMKAGELDREGNTLNATDVPTLWTRDKLKQGTYIVNPKTPEELYIVDKTNNYTFQGDFTIYTLQLVVGSKDTQKPNKAVNFGKYD